MKCCAGQTRRFQAHVRSGFSLVEVMCAILILGVALVGLTQGLTTALTSNKESELQTSAALLAAAQIETVRADKYLTDGETEGECGKQLPLYNWKQTISPTDVPGLHDVKVVISHSQTGLPIYELQTLLFDSESITDESSTETRTKPVKPRRRSEGDN